MQTSMSNKLLLNRLPHRIVAFVAGAALLLGVAFAATATVGEDEPFFDTGDPAADYILACMMRDQMGVSTQALGPAESQYKGDYSTRFKINDGSRTLNSSAKGSNIYPTPDNQIFGVVTKVVDVWADPTGSEMSVYSSSSDGSVTCDFYVTSLGLSGSDYKVSGSFTSTYLVQIANTTTASSAINPGTVQLLVNGTPYGDPLSVSGRIVTVPETVISHNDFPTIDTVGFRIVYTGSTSRIYRDNRIQCNGLYSFSLSGLTYEVITPPPTYPIPEEQYNGLIGAIDRVQAAVSEPSPMDKFESDYLETFGGQIDNTEQALSPTNPALPNNGDVGGFTQDIQQTMGITGSSFNSQEFADAVSGISGADATGDAGIWQFFTQQVADDLATPSGSTRDVPDPAGDLEDYIKSAEGWLSKW